jgi:RHS repeat-associated protein
VNTSLTPNVQYGYTLMAGGQNNSRLTSLTYPSSYVGNFTYASGLNSNISRLSSISDSGGTLESYKYLGLATVVERDHPQPNVNLTYLKQTGDGNANNDGGDQYTGLDRFGQVIDQFWVNAGTGQAVDRTQYGHDQDGNVLYAANLVDAAFSNLYQYNPLNELTSYQRGTLNSTRTGLVGNPTDSQSWSLDALGNWSSVTTNGTQQTRTHNAENELTAQNGTGLTYDANGNTTQDAAGNKYTYDAWNRLVKVTTSANAVLASYTYDALGRRITETHGTTTTDLYYSAGWQVLEERIGGVVQARNVWSPAGIDTLILRDQSSQHNGVLDQRLYVLQDPNGNVLALVDASGNVRERYAYQPFGTFTIYDSNWNVRGSSAYGWLYLFQAKRYDGAVNLYDSRERVYGPAFGRSLQQDPLGFAARDANFYLYVGNAPTSSTDPSGAIAPWLIGGALGGVIGFIGGGFSGGQWDWENAFIGLGAGIVSGAVGWFIPGLFESPLLGFSLGGAVNGLVNSSLSILLRGRLKTALRVPWRWS